MEIQPPDQPRPIHLDSIVPGSASVLPSPTEPGKVIIQAQVLMEPLPNTFTVMLHLDRAEARQLTAALNARLEGVWH